MNGKTGTTLVWEWLEKHDMAKFVTKVTSEKPRARVYIDDKALRFTSWDKTLSEMKDLGITGGDKNNE